MPEKLKYGTPSPAPLPRKEPYRRKVRTIAVGGMAVVVAAVSCSLFAREYLGVACMVSPVLWVGIALLLESRGRGSYLIFGALSPCLGVPLILFLQCCLQQRTSVTQDCGPGLFESLIVSPIFLLFSPVGLVMGAIAHTFMRRDARI